MGEPDWLLWGRELAAIAQNGLTFSRDVYDRERFQQLRDIAARILGAESSRPEDWIKSLFEGETGYATPKIDVRGATFDAGGRILLVREAADQDRWTLPGGWADVNLTPVENVTKEMREESGYDVTVRKLAAVWDRTRQGHPSRFFSCCKMFFVCDIAGGEAATSHETTEVGWFAETAIPDDLSLGRVLPQQIARMFEHARDPVLPTDFE